MTDAHDQLRLEDVIRSRRDKLHHLLSDLRARTSIAFGIGPK
jgi:hypothetical protein